MSSNQNNQDQSWSKRKHHAALRLVRQFQYGQSGCVDLSSGFYSSSNSDDILSKSQIESPSLSYPIATEQSGHDKRVETYMYLALSARTQPSAMGDSWIDVRIRFGFDQEFVLSNLIK